MGIVGSKSRFNRGEGMMSSASSASSASSSGSGKRKRVVTNKENVSRGEEFTLRGGEGGGERRPVSTISCILPSKTPKREDDQDSGVGTSAESSPVKPEDEDKATMPNTSQKSLVVRRLDFSDSKFVAILDSRQEYKEKGKLSRKEYWFSDTAVNNEPSANGSLFVHNDNNKSKKEFFDLKQENGVDVIIRVKLKVPAQGEGESRQKYMERIKSVLLEKAGLYIENLYLNYSKYPKADPGLELVAVPEGVDLQNLPESAMYPVLRCGMGKSENNHKAWNTTLGLFDQLITCNQDNKLFACPAEKGFYDYQSLSSSQFHGLREDKVIFLLKTSSAGKVKWHKTDGMYCLPCYNQEGVEVGAFLPNCSMREWVPDLMTALDSSGAPEKDNVWIGIHPTVSTIVKSLGRMQSGLKGGARQKSLAEDCIKNIYIYFTCKLLSAAVAANIDAANDGWDSMTSCLNGDGRKWLAEGIDNYAANKTPQECDNFMEDLRQKIRTSISELSPVPVSSKLLDPQSSRHLPTAGKRHP